MIDPALFLVLLIGLLTLAYALYKNFLNKFYYQDGKDKVMSIEEDASHDKVTINHESDDLTNDEETTPKAIPVFRSEDVPVLDLSAPEEPQARTTATENMKMSDRSLMPPPAIKPSGLRPLPNGAAIVPSRGPQPINARDLGLPASTSTLPPARRPSRKVILEPGHSPLDWANLTRNPANTELLRGRGIPPGRYLKIAPSQLKEMHGRKGRDAWGTWNGKVYNLTPYAKYHPGGVGELMRGAGKPGLAQKLFMEVHPWVNWDGILNECLIGMLVEEGKEDKADAAVEPGANALDQLD